MVKKPIFYGQPELQIFKCFGCQVGEMLYFLAKIEGMDFYESLQTLAKKSGGRELISYRPTGQEELREKASRINSLAAEYYHYLLTKHDLGLRHLNILRNVK